MEAEGKGRTSQGPEAAPACTLAKDWELSQAQAYSSQGPRALPPLSAQPLSPHLRWVAGTGGGSFPFTRPQNAQLYAEEILGPYSFELVPMAKHVKIASQFRMSAKLCRGGNEDQRG